jgi:hypothetical protein
MSSSGVALWPDNSASVAQQSGEMVLTLIAATHARLFSRKYAIVVPPSGSDDVRLRRCGFFSSESR